MNKIGHLSYFCNLFIGKYLNHLIRPQPAINYLNFNRYLNYKTPVNRPKVFTPSTLPVTNANKHLKVNLFDDKDIDLGEMRLDKAKELADTKGLKLVITEDSTTPPKFKLMSGHDLYQLQMKFRETLKDNVKEPKLKEIDVNLGIDDHDLDIKVKMLKNFHDKGCTVKFKVSSKIINKREKNIPKLQEEFIKKIKSLITFAKLEVEKHTENVIIFSIESDKNEQS